MKIKLFGDVELYISWSMAVGFFLFYLSILGTIAYVLFIDGAAGGFGQFVSIPSFILVFGVGIGFTIMRKHTVKENELGKALKEDFILAGWLGVVIGIILMAVGYSTGEADNIGGGTAAALITVLYGYFMGIIAESFVKS